VSDSLTGSRIKSGIERRLQPALNFLLILQSGFASFRADIDGSWLKRARGRP